MRKYICLFLAMMMALTLAACGSQEAPAPTSAPAAAPAETQAPAAPVETTAAPESGAPVFVYKGIEIAMDVPAQPILDQLGDPKSCTEEASCAFEGVDKTYFYGSFYLQTYPAQDGDRIQSLWIVDDTVTTPEGVYIGMNTDGVKAAYGEEVFTDNGSCVVADGYISLTILFENDAVSSIQYIAKVA